MQSCTSVLPKVLCVAWRKGRCRRRSATSDGFATGKQRCIRRSADTEQAAQVYAILGDNARAIDLLDGLLNRPSEVTLQALKLNPAWDPLRNDERFQALFSQCAAKPRPIYRASFRAKSRNPGARPRDRFTNVSTSSRDSQICVGCLPPSRDHGAGACRVENPLG